MQDPLALDDLIDDLQRGFAEVEEAGDATLLVQIHVPFGSQYEWTDDYGASRSVHLPTGVSTKVVPPGFPAVEDSGPAAVFRIGGHSELDRSTTGGIATELFRQAIRWGQANYGSAAPLAAEHPPLPVVLEDLVESALETDVTRDDDDA